jgi:hypothetical protein
VADSGHAQLGRHAIDRDAGQRGPVAARPKGDAGRVPIGGVDDRIDHPVRALAASQLHEGAAERRRPDRRANGAGAPSGRQSVHFDDSQVPRWSGAETAHRQFSLRSLDRQCG